MVEKVKIIDNHASKTEVEDYIIIPRQEGIKDCFDIDFNIFMHFDEARSFKEAFVELVTKMTEKSVSRLVD